VIVTRLIRGTAFIITITCITTTSAYVSSSSSSLILLHHRLPYQSTTVSPSLKKSEEGMTAATAGCFPFHRTPLAFAFPPIAPHWHF
jgi:hypothetical protein